MIWSINVCSVAPESTTFRRLWQLLSHHLPLNEARGLAIPLPPMLQQREQSPPAHRSKALQAWSQSVLPKQFPTSYHHYPERGPHDQRSGNTFRGVAICQNGVSAITLIRTSDILGSSNCHAPMIKLSTPLRNHEIVPTILLVNMRAFRVHRLCQPIFLFLVQGHLSPDLLFAARCQP